MFPWWCEVTHVVQFPALLPVTRLVLSSALQQSLDFYSFLVLQFAGFDLVVNSEQLLCVCLSALLFTARFTAARPGLQP